MTPVVSVAGQQVDFRLVTASSRDLEQAAGQGSFNQSLLYPILVVPIVCPPCANGPKACRPCWSTS